MRRSKKDSFYFLFCVFLACILWINTIVNNIKLVECRIGQMDENGHYVKMDMQFGYYYCEDTLAVLGRPRNVVYDPMTANYLCDFLNRKKEIFDSELIKWKEAQNAYYASISWWNVFKKLYNKWKRYNHPKFLVNAHITYINILETDYEGIATPWCIMRVFYKSPVSSSNSFGCFSDMDEDFVYYKNDRFDVKNQNFELLLSPTTKSKDSSKKNTLLAAIPALVNLLTTPEISPLNLPKKHELKKEPKRNQDDSLAELSAAIAEYTAIFKITFTLDEVWQSISRCNILDGRLYTPNYAHFLEKKSFCEWADGVKYKDMGSMLRSAIVPSVTFSVKSADFFFSREVTFCGIISEGLYSKKIYGGAGICFYLDNDPINQDEKGFNKYVSLAKTTAIASEKINDYASQYNENKRHNYP